MDAVFFEKFFKIMFLVICMYGVKFTVKKMNEKRKEKLNLKENK